MRFFNDVCLRQMMSLVLMMLAFGVSSLYTREPFFMFIYALSIFLASTAFMSTNAKIRHISFEICRIFVKLSFRVTL